MYIHDRKSVAQKEKKKEREKKQKRKKVLNTGSDTCSGDPLLKPDRS